MTHIQTRGYSGPVPDLSAGEMVPPRETLTSASTVSHASGTLALVYFTATRTETVSTLTGYSGSTAAAATPTLVRMGVYSIAANGDGTLVGSTANDTTLFAAANTAYAKALSASFVKNAGQRYATAFLVVSGAAVPTYLSPPGLAIATVATVNFLAPVRVGRITGQTDLPSTFTAGSVASYYNLSAAMLLS